MKADGIRPIPPIYVCHQSRRDSIVLYGPPSTLGKRNITKRIYRTAAVGQSSFTPGKDTLPGNSVETEKADDTGTTDESDVSADRTIDVLVLYTGEAEEGEGSEEYILDAIDSGLEGMNKALERSDIEGQVTLAHAEKIDFQETDDQGEAMTWARESDEIADLREEHSADLISVVVSGQAGIAQFPIPTEDTDDMAFSVVGADDGDRPSNLKKLFDETIPIVAAYR